MLVRPRPCRFPIVVLALSFAGCGQGWEADTYPAAGRVTINGQPPAGALVQLHPTGDKANDARNSRPWGVVREDGSYDLTTYEERGPGVPAGEYMFTITWPPDVSVPSTEDRLGSKFSKPEQSKWKFTIKPGENTLPLVEITDVDIDTKTLPRTKTAPKTNPNDPRLLKPGGNRSSTKLPT